MNVLSFGEILWDVYPDEKYIGGAPLNFAAHFSKLGGVAHMLSALGDDELGRLALRKIRAWNIGDEYIGIDPDHQTGKCIVTLENGTPTYDLLGDTAYDHIDCSVTGMSFDALYFGTLALRSGENMNGLSGVIKNNAFGEIFVDVNIRAPFYSEKSILFAFENATLIKISEEELPVVSRVLFSREYGYTEAAKAISERFANIGTVIVTRGAEGSFAYEALTGKSYSADAVKVDVVSTVGAGDSFSAAFMHGYLSGKDTDECLHRAGRLSAFVVSKADAIPEEDFAL